MRTVERKKYSVKAWADKNKGHGVRGRKKRMTGANRSWRT